MTSFRHRAQANVPAALYWLRRVAETGRIRCARVAGRGRSLQCIIALLRVQLMQILIKVADISNEMRPLSVATPWLDCLLAEFFNQVSASLPTRPRLGQDHPRGPPTTQLASCLLTLNLLALFTNMLHFCTHS